MGIGLATGEVQPEQGFYYAGVHGTTALSDRLVELGGPDTTGFALLLREEATAAEIVAAAGQRGLELELVLDQHEIAAGVDRGLDPEEGSLAILFLVGSIAIIALLGPVIGRHTRVGPHARRPCCGPSERPGARSSPSAAGTAWPSP